MSDTAVTDCRYVVESTAQRLAAKDKNVAGGPTFAAFCGAQGPDIVARITTWIGDRDITPRILDPSDPLPSARQFVAQHYTTKGVVILKRQQDVFYHYTAETSAYRECDDATLRAGLSDFLEPAKVRTGDGLVPFKPTKHK